MKRALIVFLCLAACVAIAQVSTTDGGADATATGYSAAAAKADGFVTNNQDVVNFVAAYQGTTGAGNQLLSSNVVQAVADQKLTWTDLGDGSAWDYTQADLTADGTWRDLSITNEVGENQVIALLRLSITDSSANYAVAFRQNGNANNFNATATRTQVGNQTVEQDVLVRTDSSGIIEYKADSGAESIAFFIRGYLK